MRLLTAKEVMDLEQTDISHIFSVAHRCNRYSDCFYPVQEVITLSHSESMPYGDDRMTRKLKQLLSVNVSFVRLPERVVSMLAYDEDVTIYDITMQDVRLGFFSSYRAEDKEHPWVYGDYSNDWNDDKKQLYLTKPLVVTRNKVVFDTLNTESQKEFEAAFNLSVWAEDDLGRWLGDSEQQQYINSSEYKKNVIELRKKLSKRKPKNEMAKVTLSFLVDSIRSLSMTYPDDRFCYEELFSRVRDDFIKIYPECFTDVLLTAEVDFSDSVAFSPKKVLHSNPERQRQEILRAIKTYYPDLYIKHGGVAKLQADWREQAQLSVRTFDERLGELKKCSGVVVEHDTRNNKNHK